MQIRKYIPSQVFQTEDFNADNWLKHDIKYRRKRGYVTHDREAKTKNADALGAGCYYRLFTAALLETHVPPVTANTASSGQEQSSLFLPPSDDFQFILITQLKVQLGSRETPNSIWKNSNPNCMG